MAERSLKADILGVFSSNMFGLIVGLLIGIILPNALGPDGTGLYYAILAVPQLAFSLVELGTKASIIFFTGQKAVPEQRVLSALVLIFSLSTLLCLIIFITVFSLLDNPDYQLSFIILVILITPFRLLTTYAKAFILARERIKQFNRLNMTFLTLNLLGIIAFVWIGGMGVFGAFLALLIASILNSLRAAFLVLRDVKPVFTAEFRLMGAILKQGILYAVSFFMIKMNYRVDMILMERLSTLKETGYYALGVHIAELLWQVPAAMFIVIVTRTANARDPRAMSLTVTKLLRIAFLVALLAAAALYLAAPWIIQIVYGPAFAESVGIIRTILPGVLAFVVFQVLNSQLSGLGKPHISIFVFLPAVVMNILLNCLWIPQYGGIGAAMATNLSYTLSALILIFVYSRMMQIPLSEMLRYRRSDFDFIPESLNRLRNKRTAWKKKN